MSIFFVFSTCLLLVQDREGETVSDSIPAHAVCRIGSLRLGGCDTPLWWDVSPDGSRLAIARGAGCELYDAETGTLIEQLDSQKVLVIVALSDNGMAWFAIENSKEDHTDGATFVLEGLDRNGAKRFAMRLQHPVYGMCFSRQGDVLAVGMMNKTIQLIDPQDGKELATMSMPELDTRGAFQLQMKFAPAGDMLAVRTNDDAIQVWDIGSRTRGPLIRGFDGLMSFEFSPDGAQLMATTYGGFGRSPSGLAIWDAATGEFVRYDDMNGQMINAFRLAPLNDDGHLLTNASSLGQIRCWDWPRATIRWEVSEPNWTSTLTYQRADIREASGRVYYWARGIRVVDVDTGRRIEHLSAAEPLQLLGFGEQPGQLYTMAYGRGSLTTWNALTGEQVGITDIDEGGLELCRRLLVRKVLATTGSIEQDAIVRARLTPLDAVSGRGDKPALNEISHGAWRHYTDIRVYTCDPNRRKLLTTHLWIRPTLSSPYDWSALRQWDGETGKLDWEVTKNVFYNAAIAPDANVVASIENDTSKEEAGLYDVCNLVIRSAATGEPQATIALGFPLGEEMWMSAGVPPLEWSPDGRYLAIGCAENVLIWDAVSEQLSAKLPWSRLDRLGAGAKGGGMQAWQVVRFSPKGDWLAIGGPGGEITLIETKTWTEIHRLHGHRGAVETLDFNTTGDLLASGSLDGTVVVWKMSELLDK
jgi:WD40 repeat protein